MTTSLRLLVIDQQRAVVHKLVPGTLTIGRGDVCAIRVDDPRLEAEHLRLHVGERVSIEDLGGRLGVALGGERLRPAQLTPWMPGVPIVLGDATMVLQHAGTSPRLRHVRSHDYFEAHLEDEISRATAVSPPRELSVVRVRYNPNDAEKLEQEFVLQLRPLDVVAAYSREEYEILFVELPRDVVRQTVTRLIDRMRQRGVELDVGLSSFPHDARSPEALLAAAGRALHQTTTEAASDLRTPTDSLIAQIARGKINVLVVGETGAGKERVAQAIHRLSSRNDRPFVCVNCAALNEALLESELFGAERGAFTGANQARTGLLESADGGTLFLDEVGEMTLALQAKMLRAIEQREVLRVGAVRARTIDVRFVAATNRDLEADIESGRFRADLYFRLGGVTLVVPPLRDRLTEIPPLARLFASRFAADAGRGTPSFAPEVMALFERYRWPGNIRELRNVVERAVLVCNGDVIRIRDVPAEKMGRTLPEASRQPGRGEPGLDPATSSIDASKDSGVSSSPTASERERIVHALEACAGNQSHAAELLGISRRTLIDRIERYALPRPRKRPPV